MTRETWTADELFEGFTLQPAFIAELERLGLLQVVARDERGASLYSADARDQLEKVLTLVELGYEPKDIAAIAQRVGLPGKRRGLFRRLPLRMRVAELARRTHVEASRVESWAQAGLLGDSLVSEGGEGLFGRDALGRVQLLADLDEGGLSPTEREQLLAILDADPSELLGEERAEERHGQITAIQVRLRGQRSAIRRLERVLASLAKRLSRLASPRASRRRRGLRRRVRTASAGRKDPKS